MFKLIAITLSFILPASCLSADIAEKDILTWLTDKSTETNIVNAEPIRLENGELAFLASAEYPKQGNNFWRGYILARPSLKISQKLDGYGGQYNNITVFGDPRDSTPSIIIIGSAGTGQGYFSTSQSVISIRDFQVIEHYKVDDESNIGACGIEYEMGPCNMNETFLNFSENLSDTNNVTLIQTSIKQRGKSPKMLQSEISTKVIKISTIQ